MSINTWCVYVCTRARMCVMMTLMQHVQRSCPVDRFNWKQLVL